MPVKKTTRSTKDKNDQGEDKKSESESSQVDQAETDSGESVNKDTPQSEDPIASEDRQLFFSTDGEEEKEDRPRPEEEKPVVEESINKDAKGKDHARPARNSKEVSSQPGPNQRNSNHGKNSHQSQNKMTWQEKKKQRKRQKFKRPQRLPYEETETKPLEVGDLLESENLKSEETMAALLQPLLDSNLPERELDGFISLNLLELNKKVAELDLEEELPAVPIREELIDGILSDSLKKNIPVSISGVVQVMEGGHGFLLQQKEDYRLKSQSVFIPVPLVRNCGLKTGHLVKGLIRAKMEQSTCPIMLRVDQVMGVTPEEATRVTPFTELTPYYPLERMYLETHQEVEWDNVAMRVVDLVSPVGFGQRGLIVAPPRTGKTILQQGIARALRKNNPSAHLIVLLVDERPEEVTDFRRQVPDAEVIASTFDESAESHVHAAEIVIEKARRMVEHEQHVVILLDSITRLARAYNTTMPNSGKILSGGVEATALQRPKRFFGSARNIEGGGSLTILGTALVETGSKMDEVIFEEFKGTGNMELHLDRELSNKRIFPALDFEKSGTRKEELLYHPDELSKIYALRRSMKGVPPAEAMEMFIQRVKKTKNNPEFLMGLGR